MEPRGPELISRYKANYSIPAEAPVTEQMILAHWALEKELTHQLLVSTPQTRWETFERCYTRLYRELDWLNRIVGEAKPVAPEHKHKKWRAALGAPPQSVYEIGSGKGELITYLAQQGFICKATEVTRERGEKHLKAFVQNLSWAVSDGVHLEQFEARASYDVVISDQVLEHFHPDDMETHLRGVFQILKPNGRYIFSTPHRFSGPHDVSRVFKCDEPRGMHLKEYAYREFVALLKAAGFTRMYYAFIPAQSMAGKRGWGKLYLGILLLAEAILTLVPTHKARRFCAKALRRFGLFSNGISLTAERR